MYLEVGVLLEYPFDGAQLMRKKKALRQQLLEKPCTVTTRVAILGGSTTNHIADMLELFLLAQGIQPELYQCEYGRFYEEAVFNTAQLAAWKPDFVYLHTTSRNILYWPEATDSQEQAQQKLDAEYSRYQAVWQALAPLGCTIIQNNFEPPAFRLLGNRDVWDSRGRRGFLERLNQRFYDYAAGQSGFFIQDIDYLAAVAGLDSWNDPTAWCLYKYSPAPSAIPALCHSLASIIKSALGRNKKALVLDLDNTLWGGIVGDDGVEGIEIGSETPTGQLYHAFQSYLRLLSQQGVMLTVNSKNDYENAIKGLEHPETVLRPQDMLVIKANWQPKDRNLLEIAQELNILPDSLVFVDDNPAERAIVASLDAGVAVPDIGQPEDYIRVLDRSGFFEVTNFTKDDLERNQMYRENAQRVRLEAQAGSYEDYLKSLEMKAVLRPFEAVYLPRIAQLTNKSNQFNLTTRRCTATELEAAAADPGQITLYGKLTDRFGDNGVVSVVMGTVQGQTLDITLWLMSCRVLKRGMEQAMLDGLAALCKAKGVTTLVGHYYPTAKNAMVKDFYTEMGFDLLERAEDGTGRWSLDLTAYHNRNTMIEVE